MVTFRSNNSNNNRRPPFRNNNNRRPSFRNNNEGSKFSNNDNFQRKVPGRNNHNASKLIEKYNNSKKGIKSSFSVQQENKKLELFSILPVSLNDDIFHIVAYEDNLLIKFESWLFFFTGHLTSYLI